MFAKSGLLLATARQRSPSVQGKLLPDDRWRCARPGCYLFTSMHGVPSLQRWLRWTQRHGFLPGGRRPSVCHQPLEQRSWCSCDTAKTLTFDTLPASPGCVVTQVWRLFWNKRSIHTRSFVAKFCHRLECILKDEKEVLRSFCCVSDWIHCDVLHSNVSSSLVCWGSSRLHSFVMIGVSHFKIVSYQTFKNYHILNGDSNISLFFFFH